MKHYVVAASNLGKILLPFQGGSFWGDGQPAASPPAGRDGLCRRLYSVNPSGFAGCVIPWQKAVRKTRFHGPVSRQRPRSNVPASVNLVQNFSCHLPEASSTGFTWT